MPWYLRKSLKLGPIRFNLSKSGVGTSLGIKGFRVGVRPNGKSYVHAGRYGLYYRQELGNISEEKAQGQPTGEVIAHDETITRYETAIAKNLIPSSHKEMLEKLNRSYKSVRIDYMFGIMFLISVCVLIKYDPNIAVKIGILGVVLFIGIAFWETKRRTVQLIYDFEDEKAGHFVKIIDAFNDLVLCKKIWAKIDSKEVRNVTEAKQNAGASRLINSTLVKLGEGKPPWVKTNIDVPSMKVREQTLYMMPDGILVYGKTGIGFVEYVDLTVNVDTIRFIEENPPSDAKIIDSTWEHPNKNGGPDKRFSNNKKIPICLYGELIISSSQGMFFRLMTSKDDAPTKFKNQLLENEIIKKEEERQFQKRTTVDADIEKQMMEVSCFKCKRNFEIEVNIIEAKKSGNVKFSIICPYCNHEFTGTARTEPSSE
ncbi:MAG: DUF4236 domain-containing protein [Candidatus Omnitrophica bacterium]|nr:DUF4236 domain-containing protein [Candidatus Omnitrophota bacterium]